MSSNGMKFIQFFVKISRLVRNFKIGDRLTQADILFKK
jgi:hypothetical protein